MHEAIQITRRCGHQESIKLYFTSSDSRDRELKYQKNWLCKKCWEDERINDIPEIEASVTSNGIYSVTIYRAYHQRHLLDGLGYKYISSPKRWWRCYASKEEMRGCLNILTNQIPTAVVNDKTVEFMIADIAEESRIDVKLLEKISLLLNYDDPLDFNEAKTLKLFSKALGNAEIRSLIVAPK